MRKRAVALFTFLRELVSLRTTVVRNCESYDRVLWIDEVPREAECDCIAFRAPRGDEAEEWWLQVRKPVFSEPPAAPDGLADWLGPEDLADSSAEAPRLLEKIEVPHPHDPRQGIPGDDDGGVVLPAVKLEDHPEVRQEWERYVAGKWRPWAEEDRRKRRVLAIYTDLFSLYQQQKELGESYEVVMALGQLRWMPKPGVEVNRHVVAVQTNVEFDARRGVITVGPAAEGAKPRLEEDMLELDERPGPDVLTALEQQVAQCEDDVWRNDQMVGAIKSFVHSLGNGEGAYEHDLAPVAKATAAPQARWAPAVILRRRTEQGLLQIYGKILEDLKKQADVPEGLVPLVEIGTQGRTRGEAAAAGDADGGELLFPLHFNDEQREIVRRLGQQCGVVVQGPPGTGKSHTIVNLVCHLLAQGKRVLVTSHAPRALRVLKEKIPQAISDMCVVLLGNDRTALTELESSVEVITKQLNAWDPRTREAAIAEVERQLAALRARAAEVDQSLRACRESDTREHPALPGGYGGTLQAIAQKLRANQGRFGWIAPFVQGIEPEELPEQPGLNDVEMFELLHGLRAVDAQRRKDFERELPPSEEAPAPGEVAKLAEEEKQWREAAEAAEQANAAAPGSAIPDAGVDRETLSELCELIDRVMRQSAEMASHHFPWVPRLARDVRAGQYEPWRLLAEQTRSKLAAIRRQPERVYELEGIGLGDADVPTLRDDVNLICGHLDEGGKLKQFFRYVSPAKERRYIFQNVQLGGKRVKTAEALKQLQAWAEVQFQFHELGKLWADAAEAPQGPVQRRLPMWNERCSIIEGAELLSKAIQRARELVQRFPAGVSPDWNDAEKLKAFHGQLKVLLVRREYAARKQALDALAERAARRAEAGASHPVAGRIADALQKRDAAAYQAAFDEVESLRASREKWARSGELLKKLSQHLPKLAKALSDDPLDAAWDERLARLNDAWLWLRADRWLKLQLDPSYFDHLQSERKALQEQIQAAMVKLASEKAWFHCMSRMTPTEETYLKAWMQAVRNIGAGTGKRAARFRKVARQTLEKCRSAIPAWIMPIHRLAETITPGEDLFDVVIVDEASQSGAEALFLHYVGKKIIIVGDDKQIAPYNVGINRDDVELLRHRHIKDLPLSDYFDLEHSFFDQAYLRFGNRIRLCEHFRCMPEIIQFSNNLCYANEPLLPLRQYGAGRVEPVVVARHVAGAAMEGTSPTVVNRAEAEAIVRQIAKLVADPAYDGKTFGVISLLGEKQARLIEQKLLHVIGPEEVDRRRLICGDAYSFQGDERHVMFISLVVAPDESRRLATLTQAADERRFNVAVSRARDQLWLFHSVSPDDLSQKCLRRQLLDYCLNPQVPQEDAGEQPQIAAVENAAAADRSRVPAPAPFESWLEVEVFLEVRRRGYRVLPQHAFAGYKIDLVVTGSHGRLAVECDGQEWQGQERYEADMGRQRQLERCGWRFWRVRGGAFYRNPEAALEPLWDLLEKQGIRAEGAGARVAPRVQKAEVIAEEAGGRKVAVKRVARRA